MSKINFSRVGNAVGKLLAFGKKNAPTIMTGGSILLGWGAAYVFWQQSKKAEAVIRQEEETEQEKLDRKEKFLIYLKYCWMAGAMGLGSTGLTIWAHEMDLSRIAEMVMITQFLEGKNDDQNKLIQKLEGELPEKKVDQLKEELFREKHPSEDLCEGDVKDTGKGPTLFIVDYGNIKFRSSISEVQKQIYEFKDLLRQRRERLIKQQFGDAYYASDNIYPDTEVYASEDLDVFLEMIGAGRHRQMGSLLEFRDYGYKGYLAISDVMKYEDYIDPTTGVPAVCYILIESELKPTHELVERELR